jgi:hypothetical protein
MFSAKKTERNQSLSSYFFVVVSLIIGVAFFISPATASAATLFATTPKTNYSVGETIPVTIYVSAGGQAINAVEGRVSFPSDKLSGVSVSKSGSIVNLWVQEPSVSSFTGVILNPGYSGSRGRIVTVNLRARAPGEATISLGSASVLANDGLGTNVLTGASGVKVTIGTAAAEQEAEPVDSVPGLLAISSPDFIDQNRWYSLTSGKLTWKMPGGVTGVSYSVATSKETPDTVSEGVVTSYLATNLRDGVQYFTLRAQNKTGWGGTASYVLRVDTQAPESLGVVVDERGATIQASALDTLSGVAHYIVSVDGVSLGAIPTSSIERTPYAFVSALSSGEHTVELQAVDGAGNKATLRRQITVKPSSAPVVFVESQFSQMLTQFEDYLIALLPFLSFFVAFAILCWYVVHRLTRLKKRVRRDLVSFERNLDRIFVTLRDDVRDQVAFFEDKKAKRGLTLQERKMMQRLQKHLEESEAVVKKTIHSIEDDIG